MVATAIYSVTMVLWKETAFHLCTAMERRWKRNVVSRVSSVIVVIRLPVLCELCGHLMPCTGWFYGKWVEDVLPWSQNTPRGRRANVRSRVRCRRRLGRLLYDFRRLRRRMSSHSTHLSTICVCHPACCCCCCRCFAPPRLFQLGSSPPRTRRSAPVF